MVIDMSRFRAAKAVAAGALKFGTDGGEVMPAIRAPAVVYPFNNYATQRAFSPAFPEDLTTVDMDVFLDKVYALATQI